ncbi:MAG TPA: YhgE/Pip domain-containing protein [Propionicimonas sp.]|jgi:putative membrane protein|nr:YhgE/Pip domain-containing protein [Propionicimonas sp.]
MRIERINSLPTKWTTLLGLVLVPLLVAGGFLWAGWNSDSRLREVQAAIVNLDEAVTIDGEYVPLGRQLTAALVDSDREQNLNWVMATQEDARSGLATGRFAAVVIIPENFSAAATSYSGDADTAERATITVQTSPVAGVADATLGKVVANAAATTLNETLTSTYLEQVYLGFNDLGKQFVSLAEGSDELADGARDLADGIREASDGTNQLSGGASQLAGGLDTLAEQTATLPADTRKLAKGTRKYVAGVKDLVNQTIDSVDSQGDLVDGVGKLAQGASGLSAGLGQYQSQLRNQADQARQGIQAVQNGVPAGQVCPGLDDATACIASLTAAARALDGAADGLDDDSAGMSLKGLAGTVSGGLGQLSDQLADAVPDNPEKTKKQLRKLKSGGNDLADGTAALAAGMPKLTDGISQLADGAGQLADGVDSLAEGLLKAADGSDSLADGAREMADGIAEGKDELPHYSKADRQNLADVVASPIATDDLQGTTGVGAGWLSLLLVLATWLGAMATWLVIKALSSRTLVSSKSTAVLVGEALAPGLAVVGTQALLLTGLGQLALDLPAATLAGVTGLMLLAGATFVVINHALVAWWGGIGRLVSIGLVVLGAATAMSGAAPAIFDTLRTFSPITPALDGLRALLTGSEGVATNTFVLVGWLLLGLLASAVAVLRARTVSLTTLVATHGA